MNPEQQPVVLPPGTADLTTELVPMIQEWLVRGLTRSFVKSCVRIEGFESFTGGLKADLVGGLKIGVRAVIKLGGPELQQHALLMRLANEARPRTCVEVVDVASLGDGRWLMLMSHIQAQTLYDAVYHLPTSDSDLERTAIKLLEGLAAIHRIAAPEASAFSVTPDPFTARIVPRLRSLLEGQPGPESVLFEMPGSIVLGDNAAITCPPVNQLLDDLKYWLAIQMPRSPRALVHGDPHLRNAMITRHGRGLAVRLIDPNPEFGFTDPVYDHGKILHFAEPVGWALQAGRETPCRSKLRHNRGTWLLEARLEGAYSEAAERRRVRIQSTIEEHQRILGRHFTWAGPDRNWPARLAVARASAHLGLMSRMSDGADQERRLFVLTHALGALAQWRKIVAAS